jgi:sporulation protein YlmC with PRC-barrel domain
MSRAIWNGGRSDVFSPDNCTSGRIPMLTKYITAKYLTASVAASALLATAAFAQSPTTTTDRDSMAPAATSSSTTNASYQGDWRTSKLVGLNVYNNNNESVGSINDLLTDKNGNIKAAVIGVGGLLGVGEHLVAVSFDQIKFVDTPVPSTTTSSTAPPASTSSTTTTGAAPASTSSSSSMSTKSNPWYPDHAVFNATKDQLKQMPEFKYSTN